MRRDVMDVSSESEKSFEDAIREGIARAEAAGDVVKGAWVIDQRAEANGPAPRYRVQLKVAYVDYFTGEGGGRIVAAPLRRRGLKEDGSP